VNALGNQHTLLVKHKNLGTPWNLDLDILIHDVWYCKKTWSCAKNIFRGALNTSHPKKTSFSSKGNKNFLEKEFEASQISNYKKMF
jgi:hypothetical protein